MHIHARLSGFGLSWSSSCLLDGPFDIAFDTSVDTKFDTCLMTVWRIVFLCSWFGASKMSSELKKLENIGVAIVLGSRNGFES